MFIHDGLYPVMNLQLVLEGIGLKSICKPNMEHSADVSDIRFPVGQLPKDFYNLPGTGVQAGIPVVRIIHLLAIVTHFFVSFPFIR